MVRRGGAGGARGCAVWSGEATGTAPSRSNKPASGRGGNSIAPVPAGIGASSSRTLRSGSEGFTTDGRAEMTITASAPRTDSAWSTFGSPCPVCRKAATSNATNHRPIQRSRNRPVFGSLICGHFVIRPGSCPALWPAATINIEQPCGKVQPAGSSPAQGVFVSLLPEILPPEANIRRFAPAGPEALSENPVRKPCPTPYPGDTSWMRAFSVFPAGMSSRIRR